MGMLMHTYAMYNCITTNTLWDLQKSAMASAFKTVGFCWQFAVSLCLFFRCIFVWEQDFVSPRELHLSLGAQMKQLGFHPIATLGSGGCCLATVQLMAHRQDHPPSLHRGWTLFSSDALGWRRRWVWKQTLQNRQGRSTKNHLEVSINGGTQEWMVYDGL